MKGFEGILQQLRIKIIKSNFDTALGQILLKSSTFPKKLPGATLNQALF